ncbi:MAG TPA: DUF4229 domain-containing protein [Beutenbergiaceae bacterium]|nr:DUF4229 domain-containing protein [Beutenbergiaceae bacterium]
MFRYAALRISLLVVVGALLFLAGMRGVLLAGSSIIIAALLAYIFFPTQRNQAAQRLEQIAHREEKPRERDEDMAAEDAVVEESVVEDADAGSEESGEQEGDSDTELN